MDSLFFSPLKNVDAVAAKELMAYLVKLQSDLTEVNKYASHATFKICGAKFSWVFSSSVRNILKSSFSMFLQSSMHTCRNLCLRSICAFSQAYLFIFSFSSPPLDGSRPTLLMIERPRCGWVTMCHCFSVEFHFYRPPFGFSLFYFFFPSLIVNCRISFCSSVCSASFIYHVSCLLFCKWKSTIFSIK